MKKVIVFSGANLFSGGTLKVYIEILQAACNLGFDEKYRIIAFVYNINLFKEIKGNIVFIELNKTRRNYLYRFYYEFIYYYRWSKRNNIFIWIAMHDVSPKVVASKRYTYFQSSQIFYEMPKEKIFMDIKCFLLSKFYKYIIKINSGNIDAYIVQANWIKEEMGKMFGKKNIITAYPFPNRKRFNKINTANLKYQFIYPAFPRVFKNFEVICEACKKLPSDLNYEVTFTLDGNENNYSRWLKKQYGSLKVINWIGIQTSSELEKYCQKADALIFASELETWGLPISEMGEMGKKLVLYDLAYAHETSLHFYNKFFFKDSDELANIMYKLINTPDIHLNLIDTNVKEVDCTGYIQLLKTICN